MRSSPTVSRNKWMKSMELEQKWIDKINAVTWAFVFSHFEKMKSNSIASSLKLSFTQCFRHFGHFKHSARSHSFRIPFLDTKLIKSRFTLVNFVSFSLRFPYLNHKVAQKHREVTQLINSKQFHFIVFEFGKCAQVWPIEGSRARRSYYYILFTHHWKSKNKYKHNFHIMLLRPFRIRCLAVAFACASLHHHYYHEIYMLMCLRHSERNTLLITLDKWHTTHDQQTKCRIGKCSPDLHD